MYQLWTTKEVLIHSEHMDCGLEWFPIRARIATNSIAIGNIFNVDMTRSGLQDSVHEWISTSLTTT